MPEQDQRRATALVLGASGLVGSALVRQLAHAPHVDGVRALTRRPVTGMPAGVETRLIDFQDLDRHEAALAGRWLFSCLGTTRRDAGSVEAQRQIDLDLQWDVAQRAARQGVSHYLLVSSAMADAASTHPYLQMKGELERRVMGLPFERISIFQPSLLRGQRARWRPAEALGGLLLPALCALPGLRRYRPIDATQVAARLVQISARPGPRVEYFQLDAVFPD